MILGNNYCRGDFNDVHVLDLDTWEWRAVATSGEVHILVVECAENHQHAYVTS